jgi:peptidyl-prolyl cis-trans isomerase A (cyclophilin A)
MKRIGRLALAGVLLVAAAACAPKAKPSALLMPVADPPAPATFRVSFETSKGSFVIEAVRAWAPHGVDRFHYLASHGFYDGAKFFRVVNFVAQFGLHGDSAVNAVWRSRNIPDDPVTQSNLEGFVTFAKSAAPHSRSTQLFINKINNSRLDTLGFAPIGRVVDGAHVIHALYTGYGEGPPRGGGPEQSRIVREGNRYLNRSFPALDSIIRARVIKD